MTQKAAPGSQSSMAEVGRSGVLDVEVNWKGVGDQGDVCSVEDSQKNMGAVMRKESAETEDYVTASPLMSHFDQNVEVENSSQVR